MTPLLALGLLAGQPAATGDVTDVTVVRTLDKHPGASKVWEPYLAVWAERHLLVAFGANLAGKTDMGDIYCAVSTDDGKSWGEPVPVFDHRRRHGSIQFAYANPVLYRPPGQRVAWCFAMRCPITRRHSEDAQLTAAYTADGGRTWTPVELAMHYAGPVIIVGGVLRVEEDGRPKYLLPVHRNTLREDPRGSRDQFVLESTSLLDWRLPGPDPASRDRKGAASPRQAFGFVPQPAAGPAVFLHEGQLAPGEKPGEIRMVMRTAKYDREGEALDPPRAYSSVSTDGGATWTPATLEPDLHNARSKGFFGKDGKGNYVYVYNDGPAKARMALRYKVRPPGGAWSAERTFYDAGIKNSYPTLVESAAGHFYCAWDSGTPTADRTAIKFGKLVVR